MLRAARAFERLSPQPGPSGRGSEGDCLLDIDDHHRIKGTGILRNSSGPLWGVSKGDHCSGDHSHISARSKSRWEEEVGWKELHILFICFLVLIGHSESFLNIVYPFTPNPLIFIPFRASASCTC